MSNKISPRKKEVSVSLVLIDLDKTLIDANYKLTVPKERLKKIIQRLAGKKINVGLCSDSSVISLRQWAERLGITGPLIAERGAITYDLKTKFQELVDPSSVKWFLDFRSAFIDKILQHFPEITLVVGDATEFMRNRTVFSAMSKQLLVVNGLRIASFSVYTRRFSKNTLSVQNDPVLLKKVSSLAVKILSSFGKQKKDLFWDENPDYGILIIHAKTSIKSSGVKFAIQKLNLKKIVMIGDDIADYVNIPNVSQFAVGNASSEYKKKCSFISKKPLTEGVIESLEQVLLNPFT